MICKYLASSFTFLLFSISTITAQPLNVLFILVDDLGWRDLGCYGSSFYETPNIDSLAATGVRFTEAYAASPVCSPTRASILTGKYPSRLAITTYIGAPQPGEWDRNTPLLPAAYADRMPLEEETLAEAFKAAGYATFFAGKWHLGPEGYWPEDQGFDVNCGGIELGGPYGGDKYFSPYGNPRLEDGPPGEHLPDRLASETVKFIEAHRQQPFLAYLSFYSVHTPLMARADLEAKYENKRQMAPAESWGREGGRTVRMVQNHAVYAGMVEAMDAAVGKILDYLDRSSLAERTVVVFMSDNGGLSTSEGHPTSNLPLRAGKGWLYEGGIREPMIIRAPGIGTSGSTCNVPVISTDFYPTLLDLAGLPRRPGQHRDGISLLPLLRGPAATLARESLYWHFPHYGNQGGLPGAAIRQGPYKLIEYYEDQRTELFRLDVDPSEQYNLAAQEPVRVEMMRRQLHQWIQETGAKAPAPNPRFDSSKLRYE